MGRTVGEGVGTGIGPQISVLGPVTISRNGATIPLPRSRKVRALLAYLALAPAPVTRSRLCDLLWDIPNDPRGELRWCLSKLRSVLDDDARKRVIASENGIALDLSDCLVDAIEIDRIAKAGVESLADDRLAALGDLFGGDLLDGIQLDAGAELSGWITGRRHRYRAMHVAVLAALATRAPTGSDESFRRLDAWLQGAPFDARAHEMMLDALVKCGRVRDAEEHVAATIRVFENEGLDWSPLRDAWQMKRRAGASAISSPPPPIAPERSPRRRASVAVMPFVGRNENAFADGLTEDVITRLAKLRVLFVIARGTVYALRDRGIDAQEAGRILGVEYVVSGSIREHGDRVRVVVDLAEAGSARIVWTDELAGATDETFSMLDAIVDRIVASIAEEIETAECNRAILKPPSSLDAWEAYHRGLWHMYKFNGADNRHAEGFFRDALRLDPTFSRAYAGLSFTHFQNAFLGLAPDRTREVDLAFDAAGRSVEADVRDPAAHWAMGRALWLRGDERDSFAALRQSIELSPNFALGHYTLGFVQSQTGEPRAAIDATDHSRRLSPFDPLQFAMLASRAVAHIRLGEIDEAADWAVKATGRPNAHVHILAIAVQSLVLAKRRDDAGKFVALIRERAPAYTVEDFLRAFRFDVDTTKLFRHAAKQIGLDSAAR
jgi:DNA-binding SARP family transcriptional activator